MSALGLNEHHQEQALNVIRFNRYKRLQTLKELEHWFRDLKESRLYEDTFTVDEVKEMIDGLLTVSRSEMEIELLNFSHTSVLLMRQLLTQAEKWHLKLEADISELENRELLEQIAEFEERELTLGSRSKKDEGLKPKLAPLNETGGAALLQMEIQRLKEELESTKEQSRGMEDRVNAVIREKNALQEQVKQLGKKPVATVDSATVLQLESEMKKLQTEFNQNLSEKTSKAKTLESDLTESKHQLLAIKEQLELAEKELDKKFRETAAYRNLRDMLSKKNNQIKELRKNLAKYESSD